MKSQKAFTLIELLVVIAIIGILSTVVVVSVKGAQQKAKDAKIKYSVSQIESVMKRVAIETGGYAQFSCSPTAVTQCEALNGDESGNLRAIGSLSLDIKNLTGKGVTIYAGSTSYRIDTQYTTTSGESVVASNVSNPDEISNSELLTNGGFESGLLGWSKSGQPIVEPVVIHGGNKASKLVGTTTWYTPSLYQSFVFSANTDYSFSLWTRGDGMKGGRYGVYCKYPAPSSSGRYIISPITTGITGTSYGRVATSFTTPADETCSQIYIYLFAYDSDVTAYFDDVSVRKY